MVIFAKAPLPGQVKTRLCPPLTPDEAATLHGTFVLDILERSRDAQKRARVAFDRFLFCSPSADHVYFKILGARHGVSLDSQRGDDLGTRMLRAFETLFGRGYRQVVMVGTDMPTLPPRLVNEALASLEDHDVVLGPALDGGYYLIGLRRVVPELFQGVPWSTPDVLPATQKIAAGLNLRVVLLAPLRDIDRLEDLQALINECTSGLKGACPPEPGRRREASGVGKQTGSGSDPLTPYASRLTQTVSKRTLGVLQTLATRLRARPEPGQY